MSDDLPFALALIAAEESRATVAQERLADDATVAQPPGATPEEREAEDTTYIIDIGPVTESERFVPRAPNTQQRIPVRGPGRLDSLLVDAGSPDFTVYVEDGDRAIYNDSFRNFEAYSGELPYVSAYSRNDRHLLNITDRAFSEELFVLIRPDAAQVTFDRIRVEATAPPQPEYPE